MDLNILGLNYYSLTIKMKRKWTIQYHLKMSVKYIHHILLLFPVIHKMEVLEVIDSMNICNW